MDKPFSARMDFSGRTALVTGGASGIGFAVARQLAELGAKIAIADIDIDAAQAAASQLPGAEVMVVQVDVSDPDDAANMISAAVAQYGKLDILVHSAGVGIEKSFLETTAEEWQRLIDIDLSGTFYCAQAAARHMVDNGYGRIVNLASTAGIRGGTGRTAYGAAKGGVITLTRVMAVAASTAPAFRWIATAQRTRPPFARCFSPASRPATLRGTFWVSTAAFSRPASCINLK